MLGFRTATLFEKRLWHKCFPFNFVKFLRIPIFCETASGNILAEFPGSRIAS